MCIAEISIRDQLALIKDELLCHWFYVSFQNLYHISILLVIAQMSWKFGKIRTETIGHGRQNG